MDELHLELRFLIVSLSTLDFCLCCYCCYNTTVPDLLRHLSRRPSSQISLAVVRYNEPLLQALDEVPSELHSLAGRRPRIPSYSTIALVLPLLAPSPSLLSWKPV
jgi:hypothetical protein